MPTPPLKKKNIKTKKHLHPDVAKQHNCATILAHRLHDNLSKRFQPAEIDCGVGRLFLFNPPVLVEANSRARPVHRTASCTT